MHTLTSFLIGIVFGLGLVISQMTNPIKIIGFLDVTGNWDPTLAVVLISALAVTFTGYRLVFRTNSALLGDSLRVAPQGRVDFRLAAGAGLFGVGWALAGFCPGPALANLTVGGYQVLLFIAAMLIGMATYRLVSSQIESRNAGRARTEKA